MLPSFALLGRRIRLQKRFSLERINVRMSRINARMMTLSLDRTGSNPQWRKYETKRKNVQGDCQKRQPNEAKVGLAHVSEMCSRV